MIEPGQYGVVRIIAGPYKGQLGYYDDEDGKRAVVYLSGLPTLEGSANVLIRFASLGPATEEEERRWTEDNDNDLQRARASRHNPEPRR
jgi:hypothetical protein